MTLRPQAACTAKAVSEPPIGYRVVAEFLHDTAQLNELEYSRGELFANIYQSDWIVRIDPTTGMVREVLDLSRLLPGYDAGSTGENVLNGIAIDDASGHLLVTGKLWPKSFELRLDRPPGKS